MARNTVSFKTKGMNRDMSVSAFSPEFSFENMNLRLSTNEDNTMMSWVTERGPKNLTFNITEFPWSSSPNTGVKHIKGAPIGTAVINHQLVLFTTDSTSGKSDRIYVLRYEDGVIEGELIVLDELNFDTRHPIDTLVSYESELVQKVYWTDDYNQPRVINIKESYDKMHEWDNHPDSDVCTAFDFAPEISLDTTQISVQKLIGAGGKFAAGVIQYAFTYYNKYGQETAIFYTTPLYYISFPDRGVAADDTADNVFKIKAEGLDTSFDYLRIYSLQRTSLDDTPITKRVQDIYLKGTGGKITYTDTGYNGDSIDPTELLYKGSEDITVKTMEQKDGTLFLGNIQVKTPYISGDLKTEIKDYTSITASSRSIYMISNPSSSGYTYYNQLHAFSDVNHTKSVPCGGFKSKDIYRLGLQFQYKNGKWSEPVWIGDKSHESRPSGDSSSIVNLPIFHAQLDVVAVEDIVDAGYRRVRPLVVFPELQDRRTICQCVACPTVYTTQQANTDKSLASQSSWFFRALGGKNSASVKPVADNGAVMPLNVGYVASTKLGGTYYNPNYNYSEGDSPVHENIKQVEIEGLFDAAHAFQINGNILTLHTPELEFDDFRGSVDFTGSTPYHVGWMDFSTTYSDIDIQTESPSVSNEGSGFIHKSFTNAGSYGIVSGLFYNDFIVDDNTAKDIMKYDKEKIPVNWMVYLWHSNGSLNNDMNRSSDLGTATAVLSKKVISNLRYCELDEWLQDEDRGPISTPQVFASDETTIVKVGGDIYMGNIDTLIMPTNASGKFFATAYGITSIVGSKWDGADNKFTNSVLWKTYADDEDGNNNGIYHYSGDSNLWVDDGKEKGNIGDKFVSLVRKKNAVRMKYKSTPHLVVEGLQFPSKDYQLPIVELVRSLDTSTVFGGTSDDAFRENTWVPCGEPVTLSKGHDCDIDFSYGDTYYQRWDCLKTYPFTTDDVNQVVEIGSFTLETRYNIAGRYDRNRGQLSNLHMTPLNFNLFNPVYSQVDNFFSYKIMNEDSYKNNNYINQVTWTLSKSSNADIDAWTHVTLASTLELDGDKGELNKLVRFNDTLLAFQDTGISQILYNENTQISTTEGVPIEIANSGKVQGKRYITGTIGCSNKYALATTPSGIYFMDNLDRSIYLFNGELKNLSATMGFDSWCKMNIPEPQSNVWTPAEYGNFVAYYDKVNQDILFINKNIALAYSEKMNAFTSFYNYGGADYLVNMENTGLWVRNQGSNTSTIWEHNKGNYLEFFGMTMPYWMTLIGNPEPQKGKVFTNIELRASIDGDANLPFDSLEVWNEYQHGFTYLKNLTGVAALQHSVKDSNSLKKRFRIWRSDIPRDNAVIAKDWNTSYDYSSDSELNITRTKVRPLDRMRNPWVYLKLKKQGSSLNTRTEIHDIVMTYYS